MHWAGDCVTISKHEQDGSIRSYHGKADPRSCHIESWCRSWENSVVRRHIVESRTALWMRPYHHHGLTDCCYRFFLGVVSPLEFCLHKPKSMYISTYFAFSISTARLPTPQSLTHTIGVGSFETRQSLVVLKNQRSTIKLVWHTQIIVFCFRHDRWQLQSV